MRPLFRWSAGIVLGLLLGCSHAPEKGSAPSPPTAGTRSAPKRPTPVVTKSGIPMIYLPGGTFKMGSTDGNPDEAPVHQVTVSAFLIDRTEVTHAMFAKAQLPNPSHWQENPNNPVERVRWRDAKQYCDERSRMEGLTPCYNEHAKEWPCNYAADGYRLPTEAEWEYACRAGSDQDYSFGSPNLLRQYAWYDENSGGRTHPVGTRKPNRWGIFGLYGNVAEWCEDVYAADYYAKSPKVDPQGPPNPGKDVKRVLRGGSWKASANMCRASFRQGQRTGDTDACFYTDFCGFRCVRRATPKELQRLLAAHSPP